jgi:hypothetical protein
MPTWHATGFAKQECREEEGKGSKPNIVFKSLENNLVVLSYRQVLKNKSGVYCFINTVNGKQYIGSAKDLYLDLCFPSAKPEGQEHLSNKKSNIALQNAILKYGLAKK